MAHFSKKIKELHGWLSCHSEKQFLPTSHSTDRLSRSALLSLPAAKSLVGSLQLCITSMRTNKKVCDIFLNKIANEVVWAPMAVL